MEYLDYIYDIYDSYINTYGIIKEDKYYKEYINHYNYDILGERTIEKLKGRGYISEKEALKKYNINKLETKKYTKTKKLFKRK